MCLSSGAAYTPGGPPGAGTRPSAASPPMRSYPIWRRRWSDQARSKKKRGCSTVCVTTGIMGKLDEPELEAVLSHELSHVAHRDVLVMTVASVVGVLAGFMTRALLWSGLGRNRDQNAAIMVLVVTLVAAVVYGGTGR